MKKEDFRKAVVHTSTKGVFRLVSKKEVGSEATRVAYIHAIRAPKKEILISVKIDRKYFLTLPCTVPATLESRFLQPF